MAKNELEEKFRESMSRIHNFVLMAIGDMGEDLPRTTALRLKQAAGEAIALAAELEHEFHDRGY